MSPRFLRRLIDAERRLGGPINEWAIRIYEWLFVVAGPAAVVFGIFALSWRYWLPGVVLVVLGGWASYLGFVRLWRWVGRRRGR